MVKYIVVHSGARDKYKLAEVLYKNGRLGFLVTDDIIFRSEYKDLFPNEVIRIPFFSLIVKAFLKIHNWGEGVQQFNNYLLGKYAGKLSKKYNMPLLALQEYAYHAYKYSDVHPRLVFQYHPQASSDKRIFEEELQRHPDSVTIKKEIEIYTPKKLEQGIRELNETDYFIAASSFTKQTLIENGANPSNIFVAPYGVNTNHYPFKKRETPRKISFVFVGSLVERKGLYYLLNAAKRLEDEGLDFELKFTARNAQDTSMFAEYGLNNVTIYNNLSHGQLIDLLHSSDVFVFPSLFEGFAFVIIEAMSTGLPVITTPRTIGLDVISNGQEGFVIPPSNIDALVDKMKYFIMNPETCKVMGEKAAQKAKELTWENFESQIMNAINTIDNNNIIVD